MRKNMMKHASTLLLALVSCIICEGRLYERKEPVSMVAADIGAVIKEDCIRLSIGHVISDRWSVSTTAMFDIGRYKPQRTEEEAMHDNEFGSTGTESDNCPWSGFALQHWTQKTYEGGYIMIGCKCMEDMDADFRIGCGYLMPVACGLKVSVSFEADLIASSIRRKMTGNGLTIELCYMF